VRRLSPWYALVALALATPAIAETAVRATISIGNEPPPPAVIYREAPHMVVVPETRVYVVRDNHLDYDYFRFERYYYIYNEDHWYRARSYRGPFVVVKDRHVPRAIFLVSQHKYKWKHHEPKYARASSGHGPGWEQGKASGKVKAKAKAKGKD